MKKVGTGQKRNRSIFRFSTLAFAIHAVSMGGLVVLPMQQAYAQTAGVKSYNIPAGRLANVLNQFANNRVLQLQWMLSNSKAYIA